MAGQRGAKTIKKTKNFGYQQPKVKTLKAFACILGMKYIFLLLVCERVPFFNPSTATDDSVWRKRRVAMHRLVLSVAGKVENIRA